MMVEDTTAGRQELRMEAGPEGEGIVDSAKKLTLYPEVEISRGSNREGML